MDEGPAAGGGDRTLHVVAVCCGQGFPHGMAISYRLKMIGLGLLSQGARFSVFHVGGSSFPNDLPQGDWKGIQYRYFPAATRRIASTWRRRLANAGGLLAATGALARHRRGGARLVAYSAGFQSLENRMLAAAGVPVVLDISEWYDTWKPDRAMRRRLSSASGIVAISRGIEARVRSASRDFQREIPVLRVPILMDAGSDGHIGEGPAFRPPYLLWTGSPHGEIWGHVTFLVKAIACVRRERPACGLVLIGDFSESMKRDLSVLACAESGSAEWLTLPGFVPKEQLAAPTAAAAALLAPLPSGIRWECCFPTKLGEYLASGRPVVSSQVGEVAAYLKDGDTAMLAPPGDIEGWSGRIVRLLDDPRLASRMGAAGRDLAIREFDYRVHSRRLFEFINGLAGGPVGPTVRPHRHE